MVASPELVIPVRVAGSHRDVVKFRKSHGYTEKLYGVSEHAGPHRAPPPLGQRAAEVCALLAQPDVPEPASVFGAYCLVFHLFMAVDNRYFGPYNPRGLRPGRCGLLGMETSIAAHGASGFNVALLDDLVVVLHARHGVELWQSDSREHMRKRDAAQRLAALSACRPLFVRAAGAARPSGADQGDRRDYFADLHRYARERIWAAEHRPTRPETRAERLRRLFAALEHAPRPGNPLEAHIAVNQLLWYVEQAAFEIRRTQGVHQFPDRMFSTCPFRVGVSDAFPGAQILFSVGHAIFLHTDGTTDIYAHDRSPRPGGEGSLGLMTERPAATLKGRESA